MALAGGLAGSRFGLVPCGLVRVALPVGLVGWLAGWVAGSSVASVSVGAGGSVGGVVGSRLRSRASVLGRAPLPGLVLFFIGKPIPTETKKKLHLVQLI